jgi:hypothetical protein
MGAVLQFINPAVSALVNLQDPLKNPGALPVSTPRQGGFTLQNRINFSNIASADNGIVNASGAVTSATSASSQVGQRLGILSVPERTIVKNLKIMAVAGQTAPNHAWVLGTATSATASDWSVAELMFGARAYKKSQHAASFSEASSAVWHTGYTGTTGEVFGALTILSATGSLPRGTVAGLPSAISASSSTPWAGSTELMPNDPNGDNDAAALPQAQYFPYGGQVTMQLGPLGTNITMASSALTNGAKYTDTFSGVFHFTADCDYIPE